MEILRNGGLLGGVALIVSVFGSIHAQTGYVYNRFSPVSVGGTQLGYTRSFYQGSIDRNNWRGVAFYRLNHDLIATCFGKPPFGPSTMLTCNEGYSGTANQVISQLGQAGKW